MGGEATLKLHSSIHASEHSEFLDFDSPGVAACMLSLILTFVRSVNAIELSFAGVQGQVGGLFFGRLQQSSGCRRQETRWSSACCTRSTALGRRDVGVLDLMKGATFLDAWIPSAPAKTMR